MSDDDRGDIYGKLPDDLAALFFQSETFAPLERRWTVEEVQNRLIEAARNHERFIAKSGPSKKLTHWIDWRLFRNMDSFDRNAQAEGIREKTREPDRYRGGATGLEISRVMEAIEWPMRYLADHDDERAVISIWFWCEARNEAFSRWHKQACVHRSTAYRRRDRAFEIILAGLIRDRINP